MHNDLIARADALRARYKVLESTPGTGHHDADRNPTRPEHFTAPQKNGLPPASENVVAFFDHDAEEVWFVGPDAEKVKAALRRWGHRQRNADVASMPGTERKLLLRIVPRLSETDESATGLMVRLSVWNDVLYALESERVGLSGLPCHE
jgi:hypothetical protein